MKHASNHSRFEPGWLVGTWEFTHTTAPACFPCDIVYHFDRTGIHYWDMPFERILSRKPVLRYRYREEENGYWNLRKDASQFFPCQPSSGEVVSVGYDGNLWWMRRLSEPAPYLRRFIDPCTGLLVELKDRR